MRLDDLAGTLKRDGYPSHNAGAKTKTPRKAGRFQ